MTFNKNIISGPFPLGNLFTNTFLQRILSFLLQVESFHKGFWSFRGCTFRTSVTWSFNVLAVLIFIPIINYCILPFLREYAPTMLLKIAIGIGILILAVCSLLGLVAAQFTEFSKHNQNLTCLFHTSSAQSQDELPLSIWWLLLPYSLVSLAEVLINVSSKFPLNRV